MSKARTSKTYDAGLSSYINALGKRQPPKPKPPNTVRWRVELDVSVTAEAGVPTLTRKEVKEILNRSIDLSNEDLDQTVAFKVLVCDQVQKR